MEELLHLIILKNCYKLKKDHAILRKYYVLGSPKLISAQTLIIWKNCYNYMEELLQTEEGPRHIEKILRYIMLYNYIKPVVTHYYVCLSVRY